MHAQVDVMRVELHEYANGDDNSVSCVFLLDGVEVVSSPHDGLGVAMRRVVEAVIERCAGICEQRAVAHRLTIQHSSICDPLDLESKAREAEKCAAEIRRA